MWVAAAGEEGSAEGWVQAACLEPDYGLSPARSPNCFAEMGSGSEEGSYLRLIDLCITQL